jgi:hypothetical protein
MPLSIIGIWRKVKLSIVVIITLTVIFLGALHPSGGFCELADFLYKLYATCKLSLQERDLERNDYVYISAYKSRDIQAAKVIDWTNKIEGIRIAQIVREILEF